MLDRARIDFLRENLSLEAPKGAKLSDVMRAAGLSLEMPCNGRGICGKCAVRVDGKPALACSYVVAGDIGVETFSPDKRLASTGRGKSVEVKYDENNYGVELPLGVAVDLGTTGISACLLNLATGEVLAEASCLNPQVEYGGDVLTRAAWCAEAPGNLETLRNLAVRAVEALIDKMLGTASDKPSPGRGAILRVAVAGNTVMQHIFAGADPSPLARWPWRAAFLEARELPDVAAPIGPATRVVLLPGISAFVGGDVAGGIVASGFASGVSSGLADAGRNALFVDIGTNGEIVLNARGKLYATSAAAGPAFEGMSIACGVRAVPGAVERVALDERGEVVFKTIADRPPVGICGSGLIDLTAVLLRKGVLDRTGYMGGAGGYALAPGISLTQKDVRQVQLAKGAISAGIKILLAEAKMPYAALDEIFIAGAFGHRLDFESLKTVGLIDPAFRGRCHFVGNASLEGAKLYLLSGAVRDEIGSVARTVESVELSSREDFQNVFVGELDFPE